MLSKPTTSPPSEHASLSERWKIVLGGSLIVLTAVSAYRNCFNVPFLLDDAPSILHNPTIRHLWPIWGALSPPATSFVGGRPAVNFSLAVNYALGDGAVWGYHAANLAIHILAALMLYGITRRTLLTRHCVIDSVSPLRIWDSRRPSFGRFIRCKRKR